MTNQYLWDRLAGRDPNLRAADADRERIAERLRKSHAEGRLDMDEFQQRLERCLEARTFGELGELVRDLPRQDDQDERRSLGWSPTWRWRLVLLAPILLAVILVSAATGHQHHVFWLWIPVVFLLWRMSWWRRRRSWSGPRRGSNDWI
jgi:Flp pilus assembly protein TadB